jgi:hypothetical protein
LAAEKSGLENDLEDAKKAAEEERAALGAEVKGAKEAADKASRRAEASDAAAREAEVRQMQKVADLERDKAKTIAQMVDDKNEMLTRIKSDTEQQAKVTPPSCCYRYTQMHRTPWPANL